MKDMILIIGGHVIPRPSTFREKTQPNETDRRTLGGKLFTDFINVNRTWEIGWSRITSEDFQTINDLYYDQYTNEEYPVMQFDAYGVYGPVKLEISDKDIKYNGSVIENFTMTIKEQNAIT
jgi:hypothetical protein